ncbi:hypothetical protein B0H11DRAFT_1921233 [Mycena galericulata]|nr:hypothetical protein B0H11DRAFT_1921233 [Mycena galericulata]
MALERKFGQWSCQVDPNAKPIQVFQVPAYDIVVTNVSLGAELRGDGRSTLVIHHVNAQAQDGDEKTQEVAVACLTPGKASVIHCICFVKMEFAAVHIVLNRGQQIALAVKGDKLFISARPHSRLSQGSSVSAGFRHDQPPLHFQGSQLSSTKRRREENGDYVEEEDAGDDIRESSRELKRQKRHSILFGNLLNLVVLSAPRKDLATGGERGLPRHGLRLKSGPGLWGQIAPI